MVGGKNLNLFILLHLNALFGMKCMKVLVFLQHLVSRAVGFFASIL